MLSAHVRAEQRVSEICRGKGEGGQGQRPGVHTPYALGVDSGT